MYDRLVDYSEGGAKDVNPMLAESWKQVDDVTWLVSIRKGVKFHNGDPLTAEDVVFSFSRYKAARGKTILKRTEKVEAVSPFLVRIQFKDSFPDFLEQLLPGGSAMLGLRPRNT
jgi:peptide/nickel transport system substrate-binding protein